MRYIILLILCFRVFHGECWWLENSYLLWTTKNASLSTPLVTLASLDDSVPGAIGQSGTRVLLGDETIGMGWHHGYLLSLGTSLPQHQNISIEIKFLSLPKKKQSYTVHTTGEPGSLNVAVPIFDVTGLWGLNGIPGETIFILPGPLSGPGFKGMFSLKRSSQLLGSELNAKITLSSSELDVECIGGFRWLQLDETLSFSGATQALPEATVTGFYDFKDQFKCVNNFYGPQIGLKANFKCKNLILDGFAKAAIGCMSQTQKISGSSQTSHGNLFYKTLNTENDILNGGIFSEPSNQGSHKYHQLAFVIETGIQFSYCLTPFLDIGLGYNFLWINDVLRPEGAIDRKINPTETALAEASRESMGAGPLEPIPFAQPQAAPFPAGPEKSKIIHRHTRFWAQGLVAHLKFNF